MEPAPRNGDAALRLAVCVILAAALWYAGATWLREHPVPLWEKYGPWLEEHPTRAVAAVAAALYLLWSTLVLPEKGDSALHMPSQEAGDGL